MNNYEYIEFSFVDVSTFKSLKQVYYQIKESRDNQEQKLDEFLLNMIPNYCLEYFKESEKLKSWDLVSLLGFLIESLDVNFEDLFEKQDGIGRLEFEANGYPYGGPDTLIIFLKSFKCNPFEVNDGADVYQIKWLSDYEFEFSLVPEDKYIVNLPPIEIIKNENNSQFSGLRHFLQRFFK